MGVLTGFGTSGSSADKVGNAGTHDWGAAWTKLMTTGCATTGAAVSGASPANCALCAMQQSICVVFGEPDSRAIDAQDTCCCVSSIWRIAATQIADDTIDKANARPPAKNREARRVGCRCIDF